MSNSTWTFVHLVAPSGVYYIAPKHLKGYDLRCKNPLRFIGGWEAWIERKPKRELGKVNLCYLLSRLVVPCGGGPIRLKLKKGNVDSFCVA